MKKLTTFQALLIVIIGIAICGAFGYWSMKHHPRLLDNVSKDIALIDATTIVDKKWTMDTDYAKIDVSYPQFAQTDDEFNAALLKIVTADATEFAQTAEENYKARLATALPTEHMTALPSDDDKFAFYGKYTIVQSNAQYISFVMHYGGFNGGAHGYDTMQTFAYDVGKQRVMLLSDIFPGTPTATYLSTIATYVRADLTKRFAVIDPAERGDSTPEAIDEYIQNMTDMITEGTDPKDASNFQHFTFTPTAVHFYFEQYQVGPYVIGEPEVEMPR